jgi:hypothetical protein
VGKTVGAFKDSVEHSTKDGAPLSTAIIQFIVQQTPKEKEIIEV